MTILAAILVLSAGIGLVWLCGACWGGLLLGGFDLIGKGLIALLEAFDN